MTDQTYAHDGEQAARGKALARCEAVGGLLWEDDCCEKENPMITKRSMFRWNAELYQSLTAPISPAACKLQHGYAARWPAAATAWASFGHMPQGGGLTSTLDLDADTARCGRSAPKRHRCGLAVLEQRVHQEAQHLGAEDLVARQPHPPVDPVGAELRACCAPQQSVGMVTVYKRVDGGEQRHGRGGWR